MTIAGSDSGGGAGIEADLRTFAAMGVHGTVALTAVTAQNTHEVRAVCALEAEMVKAQVEAVADDVELASVKTGMLARPATVLAVAELARDGRLPRLVVDPVLVTSTGHPLMEDGGVEAYREGLLAHALIATPNLREAAVLAKCDVRELATLEALTDAARALLRTGARAVLIKGGHFQQRTVTAELAPDVLVTIDDTVIFESKRVSTSNDHGTGCSMAAAIAARLGLGDDVASAVAVAKDFVHEALVGAASWQLGRGHGPIDHMGWSRA
jgi:hydroxymethylpyrimidine/phosphomethylpyrimidine kinase